MEDKLSRESKKDIKKRWSAQYNELEKMVNEWDPLNLIRGGAPKDEYDCLSTQLLSLLHNGIELNALKDYVLKELHEHFGLSVDDIKPLYRQGFIDRVNAFCTKAYSWFKDSIDKVQ